jgi:N-acetylglucosamine malate deacetylase 1
MPVDVLAIAAHPDDVEMTCGGTLAQMKRRGRTFGIVDLTGGEMGTRGNAEMRRREAERAAEILGAEFRETLNFGDGGLKTTRENELVIMDVIRRHRPRLVITSVPDDRHPDHARAGRLVADAAYYAGLRKIETAHPAHRPQQTIYFPTARMHEPNLVVDITPVIEIRREAIRAFVSQFYTEGSAEPETMISQRLFVEALDGRARHVGFLIGVDFAEGFISRRPPRIDDLVDVFEGAEPGF